MTLRKTTCKLSHSLLPAHLNKCLLCCGNCLFFFSFACVRLEKRFLCSKTSVTISFQLQKLSHTGYFTIGNNKCLLPCSFLTEYSRTIFFFLFFIFSKQLRSYCLSTLRIQSHTLFQQDGIIDLAEDHIGKR